MSENLIDKAIDYIHEHGWRQLGVPGNSARSVCINQALVRASGNDYGLSSIGMEYVALELGLNRRNLGGVWEFNDDPNTTLEDVLLAMKKASARLDDEQSA